MATWRQITPPDGEGKQEYKEHQVSDDAQHHVPANHDSISPMLFASIMSLIEAIYNGAANGTLPIAHIQDETTVIDLFLESNPHIEDRR